MYVDMCSAVACMLIQVVVLSLSMVSAVLNICISDGWYRNCSFIGLVVKVDGWWIVGYIARHVLSLIPTLEVLFTCWAVFVVIGPILR